MSQRKDRVAVCLLGVAVGLYIAVFTALTVIRYDTFHAATFDLGLTAQVMWNTAQGRWFETSIDRATNVALIGSYLGNHVSPILLLLAPLYRLWPDPRLLLVLQSIALGMAAFPLYWIARQRVGSPTTALIVACCYLAYPALGFLNLFDVHSIVFSIPLLFLAYWAWLEKRHALFWVAVVLALFTKEEVAVPLWMWGVVNLWQRERRLTGLALLALGGVWFVLCLGWVIPFYNEGQPYRFLQLWSHLPGISVQPSLGGTAQVADVSSETYILFLIHLFLPLGFLPFLGPASFVVALPSLVYLLLGKRPAFHSVGYQYPAVLIPWFFLAAVEGLQRAGRLTGRLGRGRLGRLGLAFMVIGTIGINVPLNPIYLYARAGFFRPDPYHAEIGEALAQIPPQAGVATVNRFGPQLANRRILVALEYPPPLRLDHVQMADYVLLDLVDCRTVSSPEPRAAYADIVSQVLQTRQYRVRNWSGRILLLERGTPMPEELTGVLDYVGYLAERDWPCWP